MIQDMVQGAAAVDAPSGCHPGSEARVWAARITECWRSSVEGIIRTGRLLIEAKADLAHGEFGSMCASELPFTQRTAQMLMAIAADPRLANAKFISYLPASWGTLYELTKLSDDEFTNAIEQRVIRPDMLRGEAELIRPLTHRAPSSDGSCPVPPSDVAGDNANGSRMKGDADDSPSAHRSSPTSNSGSLAPDIGTTQCEDRASPGPSETQMPSGGLAIAHPRIEPADSLDFFPTPPWATRAFVEHVLRHLERDRQCKFQTAWESACGKGHMAEPLKEYFRDVLASDVHDYGYGDGVPINFLSVNGPVKVDWIITNPPFNDSADFVLKALKLAGTGVAMFVRLAWLESVGRYEKIFRDHPPTQLAIFTERVPLHKGRWEEDGTTMTAYIWLVWIKGAEPRAPFWIPPGCRERLTRPEDIKRFGKSVVEGEAA